MGFEPIPRFSRERILSLTRYVATQFQVGTAADPGDRLRLQQREQIPKRNKSSVGNFDLCCFRPCCRCLKILCSHQMASCAKSAVSPSDKAVSSLVFRKLTDSEIESLRNDSRQAMQELRRLDAQEERRPVQRVRQRTAGQ
jgi:hypothetical protein